MVCMLCGKENNNDAKKCVYCGYVFDVIELEVNEAESDDIGKKSEDFVLATELVVHEPEEAVVDVKEDEQDSEVKVKYKWRELPKKEENCQRNH